jgi:methylated-DNA-protein-cysteine methyltransferase related protein
VSEFADRVRAVVAGLGPGEVATYGEVAEEVGAPGAARAAGTVLARSGGLPWWRVVHADGRLVRGHQAEQAGRLRAEGVLVRGGRVVARARAGRGGPRRTGAVS